MAGYHYCRKKLTSLHSPLFCFKMNLHPEVICISSENSSSSSIESPLQPPMFAPVFEITFDSSSNSSMESFSDVFKLPSFSSSSTSSVSRSYLGVFELPSFSSSSTSSISTINYSEQDDLLDTPPMSVCRKPIKKYRRLNRKSHM